MPFRHPPLRKPERNPENFSESLGGVSAPALYKNLAVKELEIKSDRENHMLKLHGRNVLEV